MRKNLAKRLGYLVVATLVALTVGATSTYALFDLNFMTGATATLIIVILALAAAAIIYAKFFRGSITKLYKKIKKN